MHCNSCLQKQGKESEAWVGHWSAKVLTEHFHVEVQLELEFKYTDEVGITNWPWKIVPEQWSSAQESTIPRFSSQCR